MERRLNKRINDYVHTFKTELATHVKQVNGFDNNPELQSVLNYVYNYDKFELHKDDFMKRKRVKNMVPTYERCCAKRANGEQCTRRKKDEFQYCGTHSKGTPHGIISDKEPINTTTKIEVSAIDIKGIVYYLDQNGNVYDTEDIISNQKNPRIIAKYEKIGEEYSIPELFS
tara:strand:+ start:1353 stop:1865 length:513 start_codon:yes stop_codon:yes gene_type:complete